MRIGLVINPLAGLGGAIGLKGSDDIDVDEALARGGRRVSEERARQALRSIEGLAEHELLTASGGMGACLLTDLGLKYEIVHQAAEPSTSYDTVAAVKSFVKAEAELIIFCGGDGTAADVLSASPGGIVCIGIPAGVKMHSAVFANTPVEAGMIVGRFLKGGIAMKEGEVMDIDEEAFRHGELRAVPAGPPHRSGRFRPAAAAQRHYRHFLRQRREGGTGRGVRLDHATWRALCHGTGDDLRRALQGHRGPR